MRTTIMVWAVILALQVLVVTFVFKPFVKEVTLVIYGIVLALQGYQVLIRLPWMKSLLR